MVNLQDLELDLEPIFTNFGNPLVATNTKKELLDCAPAKKSPKNFTLEDAVTDFGLTYSSKYTNAEKHLWTIETLPDVRVMQPSASLVSLLDDYTGIYDRTTEAGCMVAVDLLLCDCIAQLRGKRTENGALPYTTRRWEDVKVFRDVSFNHTIIDGSQNLSKGVVISGRVDYGVGIAVRSGDDPNRNFHSFLLCVGCKVQGNLLSAQSQLIVYLASLRQSRIKRGKRSLIYGMVTNGLAYIFVAITNAGVLQMSKQFDVMNGDLPIILGCLRYILEKALSNMRHVGGV